MKLLDRLQNELDLAYMFITHDLATVRAIADEVVVMKDGQCGGSGTKDGHVYPAASRLYRPAAELGCREMDPDWLDRLLEERGVDNIGEGGRAYHLPDPPTYQGAPSIEKL